MALGEQGHSVPPAWAGNLQQQLCSKNKGIVPTFCNCMFPTPCTQEARSPPGETSVFYTKQWCTGSHQLSYVLGQLDVDAPVRKAQVQKPLSTPNMACIQLLAPFAGFCLLAGQRQVVCTLRPWDVETNHTQRTRVLDGALLRVLGGCCRVPDCSLFSALTALPHTARPATPTQAS